MNKVFEMILERLEDTKNFEHLDGEKRFNADERNVFDNVKEIVQDVAEEYGDGWTPCSEWLPEENQEVLLQSPYGNMTIGTMKTNDGVKGFYESDNSWASADTYMAWRPLPEPYQPK